MTRRWALQLSVLCTSLMGQPMGLVALGAPDVGQLFFKKTIVDLGEMKRGEKRSADFHFKNLGEEEVRFVGVHESCGCLVSDFHKGPYAPGAEGHLRVTFDSVDHKGKVLKTVILVTDEPLLPERVLTIKAHVLTDLVLSPPLIDWGVISPLSSLPMTKEVILTQVEKGKTIAISKPATASRFFSTALTPLQEGRYSLKVTLNSLPPIGRFREILRLETDLPHLRILPLPMLGEVTSRIQPDLDYLDFGQVSVENGKSRQFNLKSEAPFKIEKIETFLYMNGEAVDSSSKILDLVISNQDTATKDKTVTVNLKEATELRGSLHGQVYLYTDDQKDKISVNVYGTIVDRKE